MLEDAETQLAILDLQRRVVELRKEADKMDLRRVRNAPLREAIQAMRRNTRDWSSACDEAFNAATAEATPLPPRQRRRQPSPQPSTKSTA